MPDKAADCVAALAEVTMFIIERRTAGVLAALATTAVMVALGSAWDRVDEVEIPYTATSTPVVVTSIGPRVRPIAFGASEAQTGREIPENSQSK
jgi:hypothetical protein